MFQSEVPEIRIGKCNDAPINPRGDYVLYWMIAFRRTGWNFSLQRAVDWAVHLQRPLVILEALRVRYPRAGDRLHSFILEGTAFNARIFDKSGVFHYPYVEPVPGAGKGLLKALSEKASVVVTDDFPAFFLPRMIESAAGQVRVLLEKVDSNGILPMRSTDRVFTTAYSFRRFLQKELPPHLADFPKPDPLRGKTLPGFKGLPAALLRRWPPAGEQALKRTRALIASLPIDHGVPPALQRGGGKEARRRLDEFLAKRLNRYSEDRNHPDLEATSRLSPYLHFGHISVHEIFHRLAKKEGWSPDRLSPRAGGGRSGWWGMGAGAEAFLDQLITWRELGFNMCGHRSDYDQYENLPRWALETLRDHLKDPRPHLYDLEELESARTHDDLWNAAQTELMVEGRIHNYIRMLWGKKILEWTADPRQALQIMIHLNDKYALDGRDPNSYSGIFWVLGRYDRAWGPERPVFGKVRYMSSRRTARKVRADEYMNRYGAGISDVE